MPAYLILKEVKNDRISDLTEEVGIVIVDDYREADEIVAKLNENDPEGKIRWNSDGNYFKKEMDILTLNNCLKGRTY